MSPKRARSARRSAASARSRAPARSRPPALQRRGGGAQVDLGLARPGDAVEQQRLGPAQRRSRPRARRRLVGGQAATPAPRGAHRAGSPAAAAGRAARGRSGRAPSRRRRVPWSAGASAAGSGAPAAQAASSAARWRLGAARPRRPARRSPAVVSSATSAVRRPPRAPGRTGGGDEDQPERPRRGRAVLVGDPLRQAHELGRHALLERLQRRRQALGRDRGLLRELDDHAQHLAAAERHDQQRADLDARAAPPGRR